MLMFGCSLLEGQVDPTLKVFQRRPVKKIIKISPKFLELRDDTTKIASLCDLEICKNWLVLAIKFVVFLYSVYWNYCHPNKHLAS